jgi:hypothetical protein
MGSWRGDIQLRPRPRSARFARWQAAREAAREAIRLPSPRPPLAAPTIRLQPAAAPATGTPIRPIPRR